MVDRVLKHSGAGRLTSQDATIPTTSILNRSQSQQHPDALLSLPEFIRESIPPASAHRTLNPNTLLSLPEFFKEQHLLTGSSDISGARSAPMSALSSQASASSSTSSLGKLKGPPTTKSVVGGNTITAQLHNTVSRMKKQTRNRSNSAPPLNLSWLKGPRSPSYLSGSSGSGPGPIALPPDDRLASSILGRSSTPSMTTLLEGAGMSYLLTLLEWCF